MNACVPLWWLPRPLSRRNSIFCISKAFGQERNSLRCSVASCNPSPYQGQATLKKSHFYLSSSLIASCIQCRHDIHLFRIYNISRRRPISYRGDRIPLLVSVHYSVLFLRLSSQTTRRWTGIYRVTIPLFIARPFANKLKNNKHQSIKCDSSLTDSIYTPLVNHSSPPDRIWDIIALCKSNDLFGMGFCCCWGRLG